MATLRSVRGWYRDVITIAYEIKQPQLADKLLQCSSLTERVVMLRDTLRYNLTHEDSRSKFVFAVAALEIAAALDEWMIPLLEKHPEANSLDDLVQYDEYAQMSHYVAMEAMWIFQWIPSHKHSRDLSHPAIKNLFSLLFRTAIGGWTTASRDRAPEIMERLLPLADYGSKKEAELLIKTLRADGGGAKDSRYVDAMQQVRRRMKAADAGHPLANVYMALAHAWVNALGVDGVQELLPAKAA